MYSSYGRATEWSIEVLFPRSKYNYVKKENFQKNESTLFLPNRGPVFNAGETYMKAVQLGASGREFIYRM